MCWAASLVNTTGRVPDVTAGVDNKTALYRLKVLFVAGHSVGTASTLILDADKNRNDRLAHRQGGSDQSLDARLKVEPGIQFMASAAKPGLASIFAPAPQLPMIKSAPVAAQALASL
jgi:hypothetical protein